MAMTPLEFERRYGGVWLELDALLDGIEGLPPPPSLTAKPKGKGKRYDGAGRIPALYREACHHLALATDRHYPHFLVTRLQTLVSRAHQVVYRAKTRFWAGTWHYVAVEFPSLVRADARLALVSLLVFAVPLLGFGIACYFVPETIYSVFDPAHVANMEQMYDPAANVIGHGRAADTDFMMFGFYIRNNVGISFQVFASGLLAGIGSLFYLAANGVFIRAVAGYLTSIHYSVTFWQFVCGHSAFELTAIVISGIAGLKMGMALLAPGQLTRRAALMQAAATAIKLMYGVAAMLLVAALLEAFWSSSRWISPEIKYAAAGVLWSAVLYYFLFQGRPRRVGI
jgi:uncharacterized membrane protein SpoIIM required for sporulation